MNFDYQIPTSGSDSTVNRQNATVSSAINPHDSHDQQHGLAFQQPPFSVGVEPQPLPNAAPHQNHHFDPSTSVPSAATSRQPTVSNLTKSLAQNYDYSQSMPANPPAYSASNKFMPYSSFDNSSSSYKKDSLYIPSSHNTPNMVSSSYSSNHSFNRFGSFKPSHAIPTTNLSVEGVNQATMSMNRSSAIPPSASFPNSLPQSMPNLPQSMPNLPSNYSQNYITEPDHYMTYSEFFDGLSLKDNDEEHLNIVNYPVNDLILMLSCLLTKIIEANDKLHPNHFDNTIAIRQKLKEEKKTRNLERLKKSGTMIEDCINIEAEEVSDDENDEMKNKYLANVLAFHGTNIPGISLHAYLSRVLKYCPVTNEVFLSLLVYFDRIAKKANNLRKDPNDKNEQEQLFVMDSYNIHRLIISGITVSSKFFSDIFYKNLRYAKVGGLPLEELNYLELQFLLLLDFKLMISVEDLQNYGDLLLRFWKREQITNELVSTEPSGATSSSTQPAV